MTPINKFILHVVHNLLPLNELSKAKTDALNLIINAFKEEADTYNIRITDEELKKAIERFEVIKNELPSEDKDISKYTLRQLLRLVKANPGMESKDIASTPDMVYNTDGVVIYSGDTEGRCIYYGKGESWCITKGSFSKYRYDSRRGYPVFYLVKNYNLPTTDKLSFVAIQVNNKAPGRRYVITDRTNSPNESPEMSISAVKQAVPYLADIPDLENIIRYIPPSEGDKDKEQLYKQGMSFSSWATDLDFDQKKQYILLRSTNTTSALFTNMTTETFASTVLPKYDKILDWISQNPTILGFDILLKNSDKFKPKYTNSIIKKVNNPEFPPLNITGYNIMSQLYPFDAAKKIVETNKIPTSSKYNLYVTPDGRFIVNIYYDDNYSIEISLLDKEDLYENIKLSKKNQRYLFDYPKIDQIPIDVLIDSIKNNNLDSTVITTLFNKAKAGEIKEKIVTTWKDNDILFDTSDNDIKSYVLEDDKLKSIPLTTEGVIETFIEVTKDNPIILKSIVDQILTTNKLPAKLSASILIKLIKSAPDSIIVNETSGLYVDPEPEKLYVFKKYRTVLSFIIVTPNGEIGTSSILNPTSAEAYVAFLGKHNITITDDNLLDVFRQYNTKETKIAYSSLNIPRSNNSEYFPFINGSTVLVVNINQPTSSYKLSHRSLVPYTATSRDIIRARRTLAPGTPAAPAAPNAPAALNAPVAPAAAVALAAQGNIVFTTIMQAYNLQSDALPFSIRQKFSQPGNEINTNADRGSTGRNNQLGAAGRVVRTFSFPGGEQPTKLYIIRLASGNMMASINTQPGNGNYVVTTNSAYLVNEPRALMNTLRANNITEANSYLVREYISRNPHHLDEVKELLRKHINETKKH